jgi:KipI family sensor histidine kinase inhibitor
MNPSVRPAGDRAALIELPDNGAAVRLGRALRHRADLVDVVVGHRTVLVTWAGETPVLDLEPAADEPTADTKLVEIAVHYDGPDLEDVARLASLSAEEVVARHTRDEQIVAFLGFQPGFAYLIGGDERLHVPRLAEPRTRVPAGSVAIAGPYSGVYPRDSPGGWRLLGRTDVALFDPSRPSPALLGPGDRVRFVAA